MRLGLLRESLQVVASVLRFSFGNGEMPGLDNLGLPHGLFLLLKAVADRIRLAVSLPSVASAFLYGSFRGGQAWVDVLDVALQAVA